MELGPARPWRVNWREQLCLLSQATALGTRLYVHGCWEPHSLRPTPSQIHPRHHGEKITLDPLLPVQGGHGLRSVGQPPLPNP